MALPVDDSGEQGDVAQIGHLDILACVGERLDRNDRPLVDQHHSASMIRNSVERPIPRIPNMSPR